MAGIVVRHALLVFGSIALIVGSINNAEASTTSSPSTENPTVKPSAHPTTSHPSFSPTAQRQCECTDVSADDVAQVFAQLQSIWTHNSNAGPATGDRLGAAVRLAFHDTGPTGGANSLVTRANGCFQLDSGENVGLEVVAAAIDGIDRHGMSRADVWQLHGIVALERGWEITQLVDEVMFADDVPQAIKDQLPLKLGIPFRVGRTDFSDSDIHTCTPLEVNTLPDATDDLNGLLGIMRDRLNFTIQETVALLGAHTLGSANPGNSGFDGKWVEDDDWFDNEYFVDLLEKEWLRETVPGTNMPQWGRITDATVMMLNVDIALAFDSESGFSGCDATIATDATHTTMCGTKGNADSREARRWVEFFARGADSTNGFKAEGMIEYIKVFRVAYSKMMELGYAASELKIPCDIPATDCPTDEPTKVPSKSPTTAPSAPPTQAPVVVTDSPTPKPSAHPTTSHPSFSPTAQRQCECTDVSQDDVAAVTADLRELWVDQFSGAGPLGDRLGAAVRLAFHDTGPTGGANSLVTRANGCFQLESGENVGLEVVAAAIDGVNRRGMSRADLWQLHGIVALERGWEITRDTDEVLFADNVPQAIKDQLPILLGIPFRIGRSDFSDSDIHTCTPLEVNKLPDATDDLAGLLVTMRDRLNFTIQETVALLGAHTLGSAAPGNSGFDGKWVEDDDWFDNEYFIDLLEKEWLRETVPGTNMPQWGRVTDPTVMMLNVDIALAFDSESGFSGCDATIATDATHTTMCATNGNADSREARRWVEFFARGADSTNGFKAEGMIEYIRVFRVAYSKMMELGFAAGDLKFPCEIPATDCPTLEPTKIPSKSPSRSPSKSPSANPTLAPTRPPSQSPTTAPSTMTPSNTPTMKPTFAPTEPGETRSPSKMPTASPTKSPTTMTPSNTPTMKPTFAPTVPGETRSPSENPTVTPPNPVVAVNMFLLTFQNEYSAEFHGSAAFPASLRDEIARALGISAQMVEVPSVSRKGSTGQVEVQVSVTVHLLVEDTLGDPDKVKANIFAHLSGSDARVVALLLGKPEGFLNLGVSGAPGDGEVIDPRNPTPDSDSNDSPAGTSAAAVVVPIFLLGAIASVAVLHRKHMLPTNPENKARLRDGVVKNKDRMRDGLSKMSFGVLTPSPGGAGARGPVKSQRKQQPSSLLLANRKSSPSGILEEENMYAMSTKDMDAEKNLRSAAKREVRRTIRPGYSSDTRKKATPFRNSLSRSSRSPSLSRKPMDGPRLMPMAVANLLPIQHSAAQSGFSGAPPTRVKSFTSNKLYRKSSMS